MTENINTGLPAVPGTEEAPRHSGLRPPWKPGETGNPTGKNGRGLVGLVRSKTNNGADLVDLMLSIAHGNIPPVLDGDGRVVVKDQPGAAEVSERQRAVEWLADRGYGKVDAASVANVWDIVRQMVAEMVAVIDSEPIDAEVAQRMKSRWREIYSRY